MDRYLCNAQLWTCFVSSPPLPVSGEMILKYIDIHGHYERSDVRRDFPLQPDQKYQILIGYYCGHSIHMRPPFGHTDPGLHLDTVCVHGQRKLRI